MDYLIVVERQFSYTKNIIRKRTDHFQESFEKPIFDGEQSASEVFVHGLTPLYKSCMKILTPEIDESTLNLKLNNELTFPEQYIDLYERVLRSLRNVKEKLTEEELKKQIVYPFNPDTTISILEWIGLNVMNTVTHVGQALRLQSLYLRNRIG
ncbi:MAG: hypothetical protein JSV04_04350 [Candidatus Heimdallarchaeota archaeon]|nr:MAG: hypothetical protein JSV04_04350 [Candidatus Heimdallarchaeota archaeon]